MTIRRRLEFSFLTVLVLFGLNGAVYFWSSHQRAGAIENLENALSRQVLINSIQQEIVEFRRQVEQLSQVKVEPTSSGVGPEEGMRIGAHFDSVAKQIQELKGAAIPDSLTKVEALQKAYEELTASWRIFYENFGVDHAKAVTEVAVHAEPLSEYVLRQILPQLQEDEKKRIDSAGTALDGSKRTTNRTAALVFVLSLTGAAGVAYRSSRPFIRELDLLERGTAAYLNNDSPGTPIVLASGGELGHVAQAFNHMQENLVATRTQLTQVNEELERRHREVEKQRQVSESLLLNILPASVAEELRTKGVVEPKYFEDVTILFTDFVDFNSFTEKLAAEDLVHMLHEYFSLFDQIASRYGLEKLKTIGDSYMCVGGLPERNPSHPVDAVMAAFEMLRAVTERSGPEGQFHWSVRIGIHTGPVIAGIVGNQKFAYDIWGESVNFASRMESSGGPNKINLSGQTYARVKDFFECDVRGKVPMKGRKKTDMFFAKGIWPNLIDDIKQVPPPAFLRRYRGYFQKDPPSFPSFLSRLI